jgi:hypothetical protein
VTTLYIYGWWGGFISFEESRAVCVCWIWHRARAASARRLSSAEESFWRGYYNGRERLQVLQHAPGRVSRASPQSNCVYPFVTLRAQLEGLIVITTTATTVSEKQYKQILLLYYIERIHVKWYEPKSHAVLSPSLFPHRLKPKKGPTVVVVRFWFYFSLSHSSTSLV